MRVTHRAPPQARHTGFAGVQCRVHVRNVVGRIGNPFDAGRIDPVFDKERLEGGAGDDRATDNSVIPADNFIARIESGFDPMRIHRPVKTTFDIVFARPHGFDGHAGLLGDFDRLDNVIRHRIGATTEAAACQHGIEFDVLKRHTGGLGGRRRIGGLKLRADPQLALVTRDRHCAIEWLHRRMRQKRHFKLTDNCFCRTLERLWIALLGDQAGRLRGFAIALRELGGVGFAAVFQIPFDDERIAAEFGRPKRFGHHRHTTVELHHVGDARHAVHFGGVKFLHACPENRRMRNHRRVQIWNLLSGNIQPKACAAIQFRRCIKTTRGLADNRVIFGGLQDDLGRRGQLGGLIGQFTIAGTLSFRPHHIAVHRATQCGIDFPTIGRGAHQHHARHGADRAQLLPRIDHRRRAARHLHAKCGVCIDRCGGGQFRAHL